MDEDNNAVQDLNTPMPQYHPAAAGDPEAFDTPGAPQAPHQGMANATQPTQPDPIPPIADDVDLIERAWVDKAKQIVAQTQGDPYSQKQQLSHFKADYMRQRYNKEIKTSEQG